MLLTNKNELDHQKPGMIKTTHSNRNVLKYALSKCSIKGNYCEFGLNCENSHRTITYSLKSKIHSFESLKTIFRQLYPFDSSNLNNDLDIQKDNLVIHYGWYKETIPEFVKNYRENIAFLHIDSDLYTSTKLIFKYLNRKIVEGTIIVFDQFFNYTHSESKEKTAFQEFVSQRNIKYEYLVDYPGNKVGIPVAIKIAHIE